jgi:hypothetical protein
MSENLTVLLIMNLFIYLCLQLNLIFGDCPLSILEDEYLGTDKIAKENSLVPYNRSSKMMRANTSLQGIFLALCLSILKTGLVLFRMSYKEFMKR